VLRVRGLSIVIYSNDHAPPHVHVIGQNAEAKIALGSRYERASILVNSGLSRAQLAKALTEIDRNEALLRRRWREIHGDA
jgi:ribonucleotide monophosphatase NagD (HAD superfamily)